MQQVIVIVIVVEAVQGQICISHADSGVYVDMYGNESVTCCTNL